MVRHFETWYILLEVAYTRHARHFDMNPTIRKILENINTLSKELEKTDGKSNETNVSDATVHQKISRAFRSQNSQPTASTSNAGGTSSSTVPKFQLAYNFIKGRKRKQVQTSTKKTTGTYVKDVILLAGPNEDKVPRQGVRIFLSENIHIVSGATFSKDLDYLPLCDFLKSLFPSKLVEFDDIEILMPVHRENSSSSRRESEKTRRVLVENHRKLVEFSSAFCPEKYFSTYLVWNS